jgi:hypothetical protein
MANATNYLENEILDHILGTGAFTMPTQVYIKLHIGDPGEDATGNPAGETTRQAADWSVASGGTAALSATVTWTSVSNSETYSHFSAWDASTAGNPLFYGALDSGVAVTAGGTFNLTACPVTLA